MFNRKYLFDLLRNSPFGGSLSKAQVTAINLILDLCERMSLPLEYIAYILATAFHETGGKFTTGKESLNYTSAALRTKFSRERISLADADKYGRDDKKKRKANQSAIANLIYGGAWGLRQLGNRLVGDGWRFIGRGLVQLTGRKNYELFGLGDNPDGAMDLAKSVEILVVGMVNGVFSGAKLEHFMKNGVFNAVAARAVVNGKDKASLIAMHYESILAALKKANVQSEPLGELLKTEYRDTSEVETADVSAAESPIAKTIYGIAGTGIVGGAVGAVSTPWAAIVLVAFLVIGGVFLWGHLTGKFEFKRS